MKVRTKSVRNRKRRSSNLLRYDPTRTSTERRAFEAKLRRQFDALKAAVIKLVVKDDAFGLKAKLTANVRVLPVPDVRQHNHWSCGAGASCAVGKYFGVGPAGIKGWIKLLGTDVEQSTKPQSIIDAFTKLGMTVEARAGMTIQDLADSVARNMPVIVCVQDYGPEVPAQAKFAYGHYLTVVGVDFESQYVFCQDSSEDNVIADSGSVQEPGKIIVHFRDWNKGWHDQDIDGKKYVHYGIAVGRPKPEPVVISNLSFAGLTPPDVPAGASYSEDWPGGPSRWTTPDGTCWKCWDPEIMIENKTGTHEFSTVMVMVPANMAAAIVQFGKTIPDSDLATEGREDVPHITARHGLHTADTGEVAVALRFSAIRCWPGKMQVFRAEDTGSGHDVLYVPVESTELRHIHTQLGELPHTDTQSEYRPHITVAYLKPGLGSKYEGSEDFAGSMQGFEVERVMFSSKDGSTAFITRSGQVLNSEGGNGHVKPGARRAGAQVQLPPRASAQEVGRQDLTINAGSYQFKTTSEQVEAFKRWLAKQLQQHVRSASADQLWQEYVTRGYRKGAGRAWDDFKAAALSAVDAAKADAFSGERMEFLRSSFAQPESVDKVKLLAGRAFDDLDNVTADMSRKIVRALTDGLVQGDNPRQIGRDLAKQVDVGLGRATVIARTEIIRAHAEGQLTAFKKMGLEELGLMAEWRATPDPRTCEDCEDLDGTVMSIDEAEGMLPLHPNCRCAWLPAGKVITGNRRGIVRNDWSDAAREAALAARRAHAVGHEAHAVGASIAHPAHVVEFAGDVFHVEGFEHFGQPLTTVGSAMAAAKLYGGRVGAAVEHAEHVAKAYVADKVGAAVSKLPVPMQRAVNGAFFAGKMATKTAFVSYTASQALAERVALERGFSSEEARRLRGVLQTTDLALAKPTALLSPAASFIPMGSTGYLAYSTARDPMATYRAAKGAIRDAAQKLHLDGIGRHMGSMEPLRNEATMNILDPGQSARKIADALERHGFDDWYVALLSAALQETRDVDKAIGLADSVTSPNQRGES
jgi:SPP1 gp7 family putative phage head morphogenesis protein